MTVKVVTTPSAVRIVGKRAYVRVVNAGVRVVSGGRGAPGVAGSTVCDLPLSVEGVMLPNERLFRLWVSTPIRVAPARCHALATGPSAPASLRYVHTTQRDGSGAATLFTIPWAANAGQPTQGDLSGLPEIIPVGLLSVYAPAVADASFADVDVLISGDR